MISWFFEIRKKIHNGAERVCLLFNIFKLIFRERTGKGERNMM